VELQSVVVNLAKNNYFTLAAIDARQYILKLKLKVKNLKGSAVVPNPVGLGNFLMVGTGSGMISRIRIRKNYS
jgi:hypothetical protein